MGYLPDGELVYLYRAESGLRSIPRFELEAIQIGLNFKHERARKQRRKKETTAVDSTSSVAMQVRGRPPFWAQVP